jgi:hypothetical protein
MPHGGVVMATAKIMGISHSSTERNAVGGDNISPWLSDFSTNFDLRVGSIGTDGNNRNTNE